MALKRYALVLFDSDGYTSLVQSTKLQGTDHFEDGTKCIYLHRTTEYKVEILKFSDSKGELVEFEETEWVGSTRAIEISKAIDSGKKNGYLSIESKKQKVNNAKQDKRQTRDQPSAPNRQCGLTEQTQRSTEVRVNQSASTSTKRSIDKITNAKQPATKTRPRCVEKGPEKQDKRQTRDQPSAPNRQCGLTEQTQRSTGSTEVRVNQSASTSTKRSIDGSNGRSVRVMYMGAGDSTDRIALPNRQPCFTNDLTKDQNEILSGRVNDFGANKMTFGTQTDPVLIFTNRNELLSSYDPKGQTLSDVLNVLNSNGGELEKITESLKMLPQILAVVKELQDREDFNLSRLLKADISRFSTPNKEEGQYLDQTTQPQDKVETQKPDRQTKTPQTDSQSRTPQLNSHAETKQPDNQAHTQHPDKIAQTQQTDGQAVTPQPDSQALPLQQDRHYEITQSDRLSQAKQTDDQAQTQHREHLPVDIHDIQYEPIELQVMKDITGQQNILFAVRSDQQDNRPVIYESSPENHNEQLVSTAQENYFDIHTNRTIQKSLPFSSQLKCQSSMIAEISCSDDMYHVPENAEVRVCSHLQRTILQQSTWPGNFAWQLVQKLFTTEEMLEKNYYGKNGKEPLSPRRRHAIEHSLITSFYDNMVVLRQAVSAINTGLRNIRRPKKTMQSRRPLFRIDRNVL